MSVTINAAAIGIKPSALSAVLPATAVGLAAVQLPGGPQSAKFTNIGPNKVYISVSGASADLAVLPTGAGFTARGIPVGVNETVLVDLKAIGSISGAPYVSTICAATETATVLACVW